MENIDIVKAFGILYNAVMESRNNADYEPNPIQMNKYLDTVSYFKRKIDNEGGELHQSMFEPKEEHGGLTATFLTFDSCGKDLQELSKIVSFCSAFGIDSMSDGRVCVSLTIPNIYVKRQDIHCNEESETDMDDALPIDPEWEQMFNDALGDL